jgi:hypothetical protein
MQVETVKTSVIVVLALVVIALIAVLVWPLERVPWP